MATPLFAVLKNNQPDPITLPHPLAGVLQGGEQIFTRYSPKRLQWLLDRTDSVRVRQLQILPPRTNMREADISTLSPPRDYFDGACYTPLATVVPITWRLPGADATAIPADQFQPGVWQGLMQVQAAEEGGAGFSCFTRLLRFKVDTTGAIVNATAVSQTVGTDTETDAATDLTVTFAAAGITVSGTGVALKNYRWTATIDFSTVLVNA